MKRSLLFIPLLILILVSFIMKPAKDATPKPRLCITFDDGNPNDMPGYTWDEWDSLLLKHLKDNKLQTVFFAEGMYLDNEKGKQILSAWANHTYSHRSYNKPATSYEYFVSDFLKNDSLIKPYSTYTKMFRFPYLKEGETAEKRDKFRTFLKSQGYKNGHVTIDASDWCINSRLLNRLKEKPETDITPYKEFYLDHIYERALFYNNLSQKLTGRQISHTLLLHHNLTSALFMGDLIAMFKAKGWDVINAKEAFTDEIYTKTVNNVPAGESLIWALAKENGSYNTILRYPAEDSQYEDPKMDKLGL